MNNMNCLLMKTTFDLFSSLIIFKKKKYVPNYINI